MYTTLLNKLRLYIPYSSCCFYQWLRNTNFCLHFNNILNGSGKACITFKSCISVINFLAVENGRLFGINNQVAELDDQELSKLTVKERFLPLIYDFKEIIIRGIKSEEEKNDVIKHFNEYGELSQCKVLKNKNKIDGFVTFRHSYSAYKAICEEHIKRPDNSKWHIYLAKGALKKIPYLSGNQALIQKVITQQNTVNEMYPNRGYMYTAGVAGNSTFLPGAAMPGGPFNLSVPPPNLVQPPAGISMQIGHVLISILSKLN